ncbi:hypothetical protein Zmor_011767 [Zophobas morio]|jgi:hypothetical protein|uniref:Uncharacterized protein n=1 Tax=Zophobas morio TaxID=2755281 RepID=A0AA38M0C6_9CUCU|nr:hypothetical protein Zmor_011767 [Zophobas morio]
MNPLPMHPPGEVSRRGLWVAEMYLARTPFFDLEWCKTTSRRANPQILGPNHLVIRQSANQAFRLRASAREREHLLGVFFCSTLKKGLQPDLN